jgi:sterol desaturase/sphingolipid hydroxylase (fatty acid hydroxylase superfamily)
MEPIAEFKPKHSGTKRVFDNPLLERMTRTHIAVPISIFLTISAGLLYVAYLGTNMDKVLIPLLFLGGLLFFTLFEYMLHRYVFHMRPDSELKKKIQYNMHGIHHEFPKDKTRLAMPPVLSIFLAAVFFEIFYMLIDTKVFGFLPGMLTGYAGYLFVHYIVHAYPPPKNIFKQLWINHSIHHYKDNKMVFGVSSPLWDYVFGTMPKGSKQ